MPLATPSLDVLAVTSILGDDTPKITMLRHFHHPSTMDFQLWADLVHLANVHFVAFSFSILVRGMKIGAV